MASSPFSVGWVKPVISRVPEGGGGAFRPRPVAAPAQPAGTGLSEGERPQPELTSPFCGAVADGERCPREDDEALWARLEALQRQRREIESRVAQWASSSERNDG